MADFVYAGCFYPDLFVDFLGFYEIAVEKFAQAMALAPDDMVLPFAYCQALLAAEQYTQAAEVLRAALLMVNPEKEGVFYPR